MFQNCSHCSIANFIGDRVTTWPEMARVQNYQEICGKDALKDVQKIKGLSDPLLSPIMVRGKREDQEEEHECWTCTAIPAANEEDMKELLFK